jgi:hypothetical protein
LGRKYSGVKLDVAAADQAPPSALGDQIVYNTSEGPAVITVRGKFVFVSESFDLETARKLADLLIDSQGTGEIRTAQLAHPELAMPELAEPALAEPGLALPALAVPRSPMGGNGLTGSWVSFFHSCGLMRAALPRYALLR